MSVFRKLFDKRGYRRVVMLCVAIFCVLGELDAQNREQTIYQIDSLLDQGEYAKVRPLAMYLCESDSNYYKGIGWRYRGLVFDVLEDESKALMAFNEGLRSSPESVELHSEMGYFYQRRNKFDSALVSFQRAMKYLNSGHSSRFISDLASATGSAYAGLQEYPMAQQLFDLAIEADPQYWIPYYQKGNAFFFMAEFDSALHYARLSESLDGGKNSSVSFVKAAALFGLGSVDKAEILARSIENDPHEAFRANFLLGDIYRGKRKWEESLTYNLKALEIVPDDFVALNNTAFVNMYLGNYKEAIVYLDKSIEIRPDFAFSYNNKANCLHKLGRNKEALSLVEKSLSLDDQNAWAYANRAKIYFALGQSNKACKDVVTAERLKYPEQEDLASLKRKCQ